MTMTDLELLQDKLQQALMAVDRVRVKQILEHGTTDNHPFTLIEHLVGPVMDRIGEEWVDGSASLSQVYMSGKMCEEYVEGLLPSNSEERISRPVIAIAVLEDFHVLGKRVVYSVLRANGYMVFDYGAGITVDDLVEKTIADKIRILMLSTLMLPAALRVKAVTEQLRSRGADTRVVVGGAPFRFDPALWQEVGADAIGCNATEAVGIINRLMGDVK